MAHISESPNSLSSVFKLGPRSGPVDSPSSSVSSTTLPTSPTPSQAPKLPCDPEALDCGRPAPATSTALVTVEASHNPIPFLSSWSLSLVEPPSTVVLTQFTTVCGTSSLCIATSTTTAEPTSTVTPAAPVRGTSDSSSAEAATTAAASQVSGPCPSNFYACSAYYPGAGCCQIDRACASTSCPPRHSSTQLITDGVTIVVAPTGTAGTLTAANGETTCPGGWQVCASSIGGGCCPNAYACGTASCTLTGSATRAPNAAASATIAKQGTASRAQAGARGWQIILLGAWALLLFC